MAIEEDDWDRECIKELVGVIDNDLNNRKDFDVSNGWYPIGAVADGRIVRVCIGMRTYEIEIARIA